MIKLSIMRVERRSFWWVVVQQCVSSNLNMNNLRIVH